jgi:outer membrane protein TolC
MNKAIVYSGVIWVSSLFGQNTHDLKTLTEVLDLADKNSYSTKIATEQTDLARTTVQSAYGNILNPRIPVTASITDNTRMPVSFIPAEVFGGPSGSFRQLTLGQQYISVFNVAPQFDIINFGSIAKIKSAKINERLSTNNNSVNRKNLFDQINSCYHNILSFQAQITILKQHQLKADSIYLILKNKYELGLIRQQDLNDAEVNKITITDKTEQATLALQQQYLILKTLCDTDDNLTVSESLWQSYDQETKLKAEGNLSTQNAELQKEFTRAEYAAAKWANMPTLSFVGSFNWQNNSNTRFFDPKNSWINSNFWSLRVSWDFPTNINKLTAMKSAQINYRIAKINAEHLAKQNQSLNDQMVLDYEKAMLQKKNNERIFKLKEDNFLKSKNQFVENVLPLDKLLIAHNDMLASQINLAMTLASLSFNKSKIEINNQVK